LGRDDVDVDVLISVGVPASVLVWVSCNAYAKHAAISPTCASAMISGAEGDRVVHCTNHRAVRSIHGQLANDFAANEPT
jgi:hypothetical protein